MGNELLDLIDLIEAETCYAEMEVCNALLESYSKTALILESCSEDADISAFGIFQENAFTDAVKEAKGDSSENIIKRIFLFIPRLIAAFIRNLRSSRKAVEKGVKDVEKIAKDLADVAEHPEAHVSSAAKSTTTPAPAKSAESKPDNAPTPKANEPTPEVTERRGVLGSSYGDDDATKRKAARQVRELNRSAKKGTMFLLPERSETNGYWGDFTFYVDKDIRIAISFDMLNFVKGLNKETIDYQALMEPVEDAITSIGYTFSASTGDDDDFDARFARAKMGVLSGGSMTSIINKIKTQVKEADDQLKKIKDYAKNTKFSGKKTEAMISDVLKQYMYSLDWMAYIESTLDKISKHVKKVTAAVGGMNMNKKTTISEKNRKGESVSTTMNVNDKRMLVDCANRIQRIVSESEKAYQDIIAATYHGLDMLRSELFQIAEKNGITINKERVTSRSGAYYAGFNLDHMGYVNTGGYGTKAKKIV